MKPARRRWLKRMGWFSKGAPPPAWDYPYVFYADVMTVIGHILRQRDRRDVIPDWSKACPEKQS